MKVNKSDSFEITLQLSSYSRYVSETLI